MVLTDEQKQDIYPAATLETSKLATEQKFYDINTGQIADRSDATGISEYQNNNGIANPPANSTFDDANSAKLYKLNGNTQKTGLGIALKVMSGDKINIFGKSYYMQANTGGSGANSNLAALDIINALLSSPTGVASGKGSASDILSNASGTANPLGQFLGNNTPPTSNTPKAFINYILLDEQFKYVAGGSSSVASADATTKFKDHFSELQNIPVTKNGYLYVYCSNESPVDVFFDNLQVVHARGPILEETHYYPFGLTIAAISSKAAGGIQNRLKFNGYEQQSGEFSDGSGLEWYDYKNRFYDNQLGRFFCSDRLADKFPYYSPYQFAGNEPTVAIDLDGLEPAYIASKNKSGDTKLNMPVVAMFARLYSNSYWQTGGKANLVINQKLHDNLTHYKSGAITLGFEINYTDNYKNANGESWLKLTSHEIVHVQQFGDLFGTDSKSEKEYARDVVTWEIMYGVDAIASLGNHDKIEVEKEANSYAARFNAFFDSQNYSETKDGKTITGNKVIDLLQNIEKAKNGENKKDYTKNFEQLMKLVDDFNKKQKGN